MSIGLRILLVVFSILTLIYVIRKVNKAQIQVFDVAYWVLFSVLLVLMGLFPNLIVKLSVFLGIISPTNFVYLVMIFMLFIRCFLLSIRVSQNEMKIASLVEELGVRETVQFIEKDDKE